MGHGSEERGGHEERGDLVSPEDRPAEAPTSLPLEASLPCPGSSIRVPWRRVDVAYFGSAHLRAWQLLDGSCAWSVVRVGFRKAQGVAGSVEEARALAEAALPLLERF